MSKSYMFNPHDRNAEDVILVVNKIRSTELEIKELEEERRAVYNDPERIKNLDWSIRHKKADLKRFKQEYKDITRSGLERLE